MNKVKLYRVDAPYWMVDASIDEAGKLTIISGSTSKEWHVTV